MALITTALFKTLTDYYAGMYDQLKPVAGVKTGNPAAGTLRNILNSILSQSVAANDYDVENLFNTDAFNNYSTKAGVENMFSPWQAAFGDFGNHFSAKGPGVNASIVDINTFLNYYNGGAGGAKFATMIHPSFAAIYTNFLTTPAITGVNVFSPGIHPLLNTTYTNGMGLLHTTGANAGTYTAGQQVTFNSLLPNYPTTFAEVTLLVEVVVNFAGGAAAPQVQIVASTLTTDDLGATTTTWGPVTIPPGSGSANNPNAALATQTISSGAITPGSVNVTVGSSTGMVVGSVLTVNKNAPDQEYVQVSLVPDGTHVTAIFKKAHLASATLDGQNSILLTVNTAGRRCRSLGTLTVGNTGASSSLLLNGHTAGDVRIIGIQDRDSLVA